MTIQIIKTTYDEENIEINLNGEYLCSLNHDEDGWSGMAKIEKIVREMAKRLNIEVEEIETNEE